MSRVQRNSLLSYGWQPREQNMQQITAQPTLFQFYGTPKATSKETEEEKTRKKSMNMCPCREYISSAYIQRDHIYV